MVINYRDRTVVDKINRDNVVFIPRYNGKNISIHLDFKDDDPEDGSNFMAAAVLAAFNYRLLIDKKCISSINKVIMKTSEEEEKEIEFFDLHNEYLIEIPITILF
jgi:hypothetical protein